MLFRYLISGRSAGHGVSDGAPARRLAYYGQMPGSEFPVDVPVVIAPGVRRLTAPNASAFTGPGTNTYVLGDPAWAIIDPGPAIGSHLQALQAIAPHARWCFVTHTHPDHSPLAMRYCAASGAVPVGLAPPGDGRQDTGFAPQMSPRRDALFESGDGTALVAIDTPGHASNHVCYLLRDQGVLFSGDHILDGVSPVILSPDGDMAAYLQSLRRLRAYPLASIAPGHGRLLQEPLSVIDALIAHRLQREAQVLAELRRAVQASTDELLPRVYFDVSPAVIGLARHSLEAHLIKLADEGAIDRHGGIWHAR